MTEYSDEAIRRLSEAFEAARDPAAGAAMSAYMRNLFPFLGIKGPVRDTLQREALAGMPRPSRGDLEAVRAGCHRMKSAAAGVGAADVARRARALEAAIKSGSATADVREDLEKIRAALQCYHDAVIAAGVALPEAARACQDPP